MEANMGLFSWSKKKEASHAFMVPYFDEVMKILVEFNVSESLEDEDRRDLVELMTSASALITASYHMKYYMAYNGNIDKQIGVEIGSNIINFYNLISQVTLKVAEEETGRRFDKHNWEENITRIQTEKMKKYAQAILKTIEKGRGAATGIDISDAITEDLYGAKVQDLMLGLQLFQIVAKVKK